MLKMSEIRELIRLFDETSVAELTLESDNMKFELKKATAVYSNMASAPAVSFNPQLSLPMTAPVQGATATPASDLAQSSAPAGANAQVDPLLHTITSPMVGTFYRAPTPEAPSYVELGSKVTEKSIVCIIEAMKLMNEIEAEMTGEVVEILAENGQLVEYGQPLFRIKRS